MARSLTGPALEAVVADLAHDGRGIARVEGKAVFIDGALPGERVKFRVYKRRPGFDEARLEALLVPSPDRVSPACAHFGLCGGCALQHLAPAAQVAIKQSQLLETLLRIGGVRPDVVLPAITGAVWGYRRRARLGVKYVRKKQRVLAGFRERESPYLADLARCEVLAPPLQGLPAELAGLVETLELREQLPQVEVAVGDQSVALVFRVMANPGESDRAKLVEFSRRIGALPFLQTGGLDTVVALGEPGPTLNYRVSKSAVTIRFKPTDFIQVNAGVNSAMVDQAIDLLKIEPSDRVLDLFCGLGNFTLPLARSAGRVIGVEGDPDLIDRARDNAALNGIENVDFFTQNLFDPAAFGAWDSGRFDLVLVDPPRAGAQEVMERMSRWGPRRVVYISCHPGSLARDAGFDPETGLSAGRGRGYGHVCAHDPCRVDRRFREAPLSLGPLMVDVAGTELSPEDRDLLGHELVGSVLLFGGNCEDPRQLAALVKSIHEVRSPPLLVAVDQEGGRVQRLRKGFTTLPPAHSLGRRYDVDRRDALELARTMAWLMASEVRAVGVDFSFAPCVDLDYGVSEVIGDRAFHADGGAVAALGVAYVVGMRDAGMAAVAKHFPGHGAVVADSHVALPIDRRPFADLDDDLHPYRLAIENRIAGIMAGHVVFPEIDSKPASLSRRWISGILRGEMHFHGCVFSDDIVMAGVASFGDVATRAQLALDAGCDVLPVCHDRKAVHQVLDSIKIRDADPASSARLVRMRARHPATPDLTNTAHWRDAVARVNSLTAAPPFVLTEGHA